MSLVILATIFFGYCGYALLEGIREAWYFYMKFDAGGAVPSTMPKNEHPYFAAQRLFVISCASIITVYNSGLAFGSSSHAVLLEAVLYFASLCLVFPFLHDGAYYMKMDQIRPGIYPRRWVDHSHTSNAKINLDYGDRLAMFVVGIFLYILATLMAPVM